MKGKLWLVLAILVAAWIPACGGSGTAGECNEGEGGSGDAGGDADGDGDGDADGDSDGDADGDGDEIPPSNNNGPRLDRLTCEYETLEEDATTFSGRIVVGNANTEYVWNGYTFAIWSVDFTTTSEITLARTDDWIYIDYEQSGDQLVFDMGWMSLFPLDTLIAFDVEGIKGGEYPYPARCTPRYIRGDIIYPVYQDLPHSWWKGKQDIDEDDLIHDVDDYYDEDVDAVEEGIFIYEPPHDTQILIGQPEVVPYTVNGYDDLRIWVPNEILALGLGFNYEWFKFNPAYFCALGTKENFACGLVPVETYPGGIPVEVDGQDYSWNINFGSPDGPFQQETGNFIDMARFFPDYFPPGSQHDDYTAVSDIEGDPKWATAVISSALSSVVTRETLWALPSGEYGRIVAEAVDPRAELAMVTYTYNQGIYGFCSTGVMDDVDATIATPDIAAAFNLDGVNDHVATVRAIVEAMNGATDDYYDTELTWDEIEAFFEVARVFYDWGFPTDEEWQAMLDDVQRAYDVLSQRWGGGHVSYRYDFLTLLRVAKHHLRKPFIPRPTTEYWRDRVLGLPC